MDTLEARSRDVQERTFCKWLNTKLELRGETPMTSLVRDLSDGVKLIQLMEIMGDVSLGRYNKAPKLRVQKAENVNKALEFITSRGVKLTNIGPEDIIDGNVKLILGMIWTLILRFTIADISEEGLSAKEGLLLWCQRKTAPYQDVNVVDFGYSWSDGLALCALIHCHRPDLLDYDKLDKDSPVSNIRLAFKIAEAHLGVPQLLEVEDLSDAKPPDERSVITYIASFFHAFSSLDQQETVARRIEKFSELMRSVWVTRNDYEKRARQLVAAWQEQQHGWLSAACDGTYADAKAQWSVFESWKTTIKRGFVVERQDLLTLFGNVQTKLKTYNLRAYEAPSGLAPSDIAERWNALLEAEAQRSRRLNAQIRDIKEGLRQVFARLANSCESHLRHIATEIGNLTGSLETQHLQLRTLSSELEPLVNELASLQDAQAACHAANIEENDYTTFTHQDLQFEFELVQHSISKKLAFIDNQIVARNMSNLTPIQLEQFESTFRHFDRDETNTLNLSEMAAALASLGIVYSDADLETIFTRLTDDYGAVTFEAFINLLVEIMEDQTTHEQLREAFRAMAIDKTYITELDLRTAALPESVIAYLTDAVPVCINSADRLDYERWLNSVFA